MFDKDRKVNVAKYWCGIQKVPCSIPAVAINIKMKTVIRTLVKGVEPEPETANTCKYLE
jgi:hypothetical protein